MAIGEHKEMNQKQNTIINVSKNNLLLEKCDVPPLFPFSVVGQLLNPRSDLTMGILMFDRFSLLGVS